MREQTPIVVNGGKGLMLSQAVPEQFSFCLLSAFIHIVLVSFVIVFSAFTFGLMNFELQQKTIY